MKPELIRNSTRKGRTNTTSWVDESYSRRLANQTVETLRPNVGHSATWILSLSGARAAPHYLAERKVRAGFSVTKRNTRIWHVDTSDAYPGLGIFIAEYDHKGRLIRDSLTSPPVVAISKHALQRLYERLRTNSFDDVVRKALAPLADVPPAACPEQEAEVVLPGIGRFHAVSSMALSSMGKAWPAWMLKTFIAKERT